MPGAQGIGMIPGSKCDLCPKEKANFSVSICNYSMKYFTGCNKAFCNVHGVGHFTTDMIDPRYFQDKRLRDLGVKEKYIDMSKELHNERVKIGNDLMFIRFCRDCENDYTKACKK